MNARAGCTETYECQNPDCRVRWRGPPGPQVSSVPGPGGRPGACPVCGHLYVRWLSWLSREEDLE